MPQASAPRSARLLVAAVACVMLAPASGCTPSLSDRARSTDEPEAGSNSAFDSPGCEVVRAGIAAYNIGDMERAVDSFVEAVPLARSRAQRLGGGDGGTEARDLLAAVAYYASLSPDQMRKAFPASPETREFQVTTLSQCQPLPPGLDEDDTEEPEQSA